ncbi:uncharacterized protein [Arachis hypogaea]|uniref:uncharacterized protein n=1 Tax=Arachis hypogaea TaxID=3818 RepID=UPI003B211959
MRDGLRRTQRHPIIATSVAKPGSRKSTKGSILRQQSHAANGTKISKNRTVGLNISDNSEKAQTLLPEPHNNCKDKPTIMANTNKTRTGRTADQVLTPDEHHHNQTWELHVDGASNREGSGAGIVLKEGDTVMAEQSLQFHFSASNNQGKYETLIAGLKLALNLQVQSLTVHCDSLLVVQQIKGEFQVKDPLLERYWLIAKDLISKFDKFTILHVHKEKNIRADILSKLAATRARTQTSTLSQLTLEKPSIELLSITSINHLNDWRTHFIEYINTGIIPRNEPNPQHFRRKASLYTNIAGELYKRGFSHLLLKCLDKNEANEVMNEVHKGVCGNHIGGLALAAKIIRTGYYWPTMKRDCITKVKTYDNCQKHAAISMKPAEVMHNMEVSWPFYRWGLDILGPFPIAPGQSTTGETPFKLVYRSEALIPIEVGIPTLRTKLYNQQRNINITNAELDLAEEDRDIAAIKQRATKQLIERRHNKKVVSRTFNVGDLVLRRTEKARQPPSHGKLTANWECLFRISKVLGMGAYQL